MANYPCLTRRNNVWYVRKRVPQDVKTFFKEPDIKRSLKTDDRQKAMQLYHQAMAALESKFDTEKTIRKLMTFSLLSMNNKSSALFMSGTLKPARRLKVSKAKTKNLMMMRILSTPLEKFSV